MDYATYLSAANRALDAMGYSMDTGAIRGFYERGAQIESVVLYAASTRTADLDRAADSPWRGMSQQAIVAGIEQETRDCSAVARCPASMAALMIRAAHENRVSFESDEICLGHYQMMLTEIELMAIRLYAILMEPATARAGR